MSPWPRQVLGLRRRQLFNIYVLAGGIGIVLAVSLFTLQQSRAVERQGRLTTWMFSSLASRFLAAGPGSDVQQVLHIVNEIEIPFIVTDPRGRPVLWNEPVIGIPMPPYEQLMRIDPSDPDDPQIERILELVRRFDRGQEPFAIVAPGSGARLGTLHWGPSALSRRIRWMPYLELLLLAVFFGLILWALQMKKVGEQQRLFAGMAKETAHQLGTPLTSIMGWLTLLRDRVDPRDESLQELQRDVERLRKVSERFSQIGSRPRLQDDDLAGTVAAAIAYFRRRLPHLGARVELEAELTATRRARFNRELMEWVLENLIKNGIDAIGGVPGRIVIRLRDGAPGTVRLEVSDSGGGIPPRVRNRIFEAGFTTKSRGWGMGLALVHRIVTGYHRGRIEVSRSGPAGTTFAITLPADDEEDSRAV